MVNIKTKLAYVQFVDVDESEIAVEKAVVVVIENPNSGVDLYILTTQFPIRTIVKTHVNMDDMVDTIIHEHMENYAEESMSRMDANSYEIWFTKYKPLFG